MAPGTAKRVEYPHDGHDVSRTRFVYDAAGNLLHEITYFSSYATVTGITLVGPTPRSSRPSRCQPPTASAPTTPRPVASTAAGPRSLG